MTTSSNTAAFNTGTTKTTWRSWLVCLTAGLFFFYEFIQLTMFNTLEPYLMNSLKITASDVSQISACYFYAEILFLFPAGMLLDRLSVKKLIIISMVICVAGTYGFSFATSILQCSLLRFMEGIGAALCFLSSLKLASRWFHPRHLALISGILVTMAMLGGMLAQTPLQILIEHVGWQQAIVYNAWMGVACIALIVVIVRDYPPHQDKRFELEHDQLSSLGFKKSILMAARNKQTWLAGTYTCLMNLPIFLLGALNGTLYLTQIFKMTATQAANVSAMVFLGTVIGSPVIGFLSDRFGRRKLPMIIGAVTSLLCILPILFLHTMSVATGMVLFFLIGLLTSTQVLTYPLVTESNPKLLTGTALSISSLLIMAGGAIFQPLFGYLLSMNWSTEMQKGVAIYSRADYVSALSIMPVAFVVSLILCYFIKETYCISFEKKR